MFPLHIQVHSKHFVDKFTVTLIVYTKSHFVSANEGNYGVKVWMNLQLQARPINIWDYFYPQAILLCHVTVCSK